jgi:hypothetical protein
LSPVNITCGGSVVIKKKLCSKLPKTNKKEIAGKYT